MTANLPRRTRLGCHGLTRRANRALAFSALGCHGLTQRANRALRSSFLGCHGLTRRANRAFPLLLLAFLLPACTDSTAPPAPAAQRELELDAITLNLRVDDTDITTTDRITVTLDTDYPADQTVAPTIEFDQALADAGWTLIARHDDPPRRLDRSRLRRTTTVVIEPFLPGDYEIPGFTINAGDRSARLEPVPVTVAALLPEDDPVDESPELTELKEPPPPAPDATTPIAVVAVSAAAVAAIAGFAVALRRRGPTQPTPSEQLRAAERAARRIADAPEVTNAHLEELHAAVRTAEQIAAQRDADLAADLERARFGPTPPPFEAKADLARRAETFVRTAAKTFHEEHNAKGAHP